LAIWRSSCAPAASSGRSSRPSILPAPLSLLVIDATSEAPAIAPPGYAFLGPILDLEAEDRVSVSGEIGISIECAPLGIPSSKLPDLQILRIADGQDFLLLTTLSSPEHAAYVPAADAGSNSLENSDSS
jgi:hypothetical protein